MRQEGMRLFYCGKKIFYLALYQQGEKTGQVGFAGINTGNEEACITLQVKKMSGYGQSSGSYPLYLAVGTRIGLGSLELIDGAGNFERKFILRHGKMTVGNQILSPEQITGIWVELDKTGESRIIGGEIESEAEEKVPEVQTAELEPSETFTTLQEVFSGNKWEELLKNYKQIHPFGDERVFICIEPRDFIILQEKYQKLVNNSFLLHGFYNYRHLILGEDNQMGEQGRTCFYLGVPGVFYEREKMVAVMFGFEGFESDGAVEIGKFGYYMRRVEL